MPGANYFFSPPENSRYRAQREKYLPRGREKRKREKEKRKKRKREREGVNKG